MSYFDPHEQLDAEPNDLTQEGFGAIVWPAIMGALVLGGWGIYLIWSAWQ